MDVFIANVSQQIHEFAYRVTESSQLVMQRIQPGQQVRLAARNGDLSQHDVDTIFDQHRRYGLIRDDEVGHADFKTRFCPLILGIGHPVKINRVMEQIRHNRDVLVTRGHEQRTAAAVATNASIEQNLQQMGVPDVLTQLEMSVEETSPPQVRPGDRGRVDENLARDLADSKPVGEGLVISRDTSEGGTRRTNLATRGGRGRGRRE